MPGVAFPLGGRLGLTSPPSPVLCAAKTATLPLSRPFACRSRPRYLACFCAFVVSLAGSWSGRSSPTAPGPLGIRSPHPEMSPGDRWLSHVPELPLWRHAPLSDPGGVLGARHVASRTAAFRPLETVGFPLHTALRDILLSTTILFSGLYHAACPLVPSSFVRPLLRLHVEFPTDLLARLYSGGT
jgi:hypothetical protein